MVYYPQHTHNEEDQSPDEVDRVLERHARDKSFSSPKNGKKPNKTVVVTTGGGNLIDTAGSTLSPGTGVMVGTGIDNKTATVIQEVVTNTSNAVAGQQQQVVISGANNGVMELPGGGTLMAQYMNDFCQTQLEGEIENSSVFVTVSGAAVSAASQNSRNIIGSGTTSMMVQGTSTAVAGAGASSVVDGTASTLMVQNVPGQTVVMDNSTNNLVEGGQGNAFIMQDVVVDMGQTASENIMEGEGEEYVLPADEAEWTKLFEVLENRLSSGELVGAEKSEAEALRAYKDVVSYVSLPEQVDIFQRLCSLTNTAFESAE